MILIFVFLALSSVAAIPQYITDHCKDKEGPSVTCTGQRQAAVFCENKLVSSYQICEPTHPCRPHDTVPATCGTDSKVVSFEKMYPQRNGWICQGCDEKDEDEIRTAILSPTDHSVSYSSKIIDVGDHSGDLFFAEYVPELLLPRGANIHGIKALVYARTVIEEEGDDEPNAFCYLTDVQLRIGPYDVTGNRGSSERAPKQKIGKTFGPTTFGGRLDTWEKLSDPNDFSPSLKLEVDAKLGVFDGDEYIHKGTPTNKGRCEVIGAQLEILYTVPAVNNITPTFLVRSGNLSDSNVWSAYDPRDDKGHAVIDENEPRVDENDVAWYEPGYKPNYKWKTGKGPIGYGDDKIQETTHISSRRLTGYMRTEFDMPSGVEPQCIGDMHIGLLVDDGAIIYLNGLPLYWINMDPAHLPATTYSTPSLRQVFDESARKLIVVPDHALLKDGRNTLAIEVHQVDESSSDLTMDLSLWVYCDRTLLTPPGVQQTSKDDKGTVHLVTKAAEQTNDDDDINVPINGGGDDDDTDTDNNNNNNNNNDSNNSDNDNTDNSDKHSNGGDNAKGSTNKGPETEGGFGTLLLFALLIAVIIIIAYVAWKKSNSSGRRRGVSGAQPGFVTFVDDDTALPVASESGGEPGMYGTEPELSRPAYKTNGLGQVQKQDFKTDDWSDF